MHAVKIIKNFMSSLEVAELVKYIDHLELAMPDEFATYQDGKRLALQFGNDLYHGHSSRLDLKLLKDNEPVVRKYFSQAIQATKDSFEVEADVQLYVCSFWFAKQYPGAFIVEHEDTDDGYNPHFEYSAVLYLSSSVGSGYLEFLDLDYVYEPIAGDLVIFPSKSTGLHGVSEILENRYSMPLWMTEDPNFKL